PDDIRHFAVVGPEEALRRLEQALSGRDIERQQTRQRQIDRDHLLERYGIVERLQLAKIVQAEGEGRVRSQLRPFVAGKAMIGRSERLARISIGRFAHLVLNAPLLATSATNAIFAAKPSLRGLCGS